MNPPRVAPEFAEDLAGRERSEPLPLDQFILQAWEKNQELHEQQSPNARFLSPRWHFVRIIKSHGEFAGLSANEALDRLREALQPGYTLGEPLERLHGFSEDDEIEFITSWDKVDLTTTADALYRAYYLAESYPLPARLNGKLVRGRYQILVSLAGYLQMIVGPQANIMLPVRNTGELMGCNKDTISRYNRMAVKEGYLEVQKEHRRPGPGNTGGLATEYRFNIGRFPELKYWKEYDAPDPRDERR